MFLFYTLRNLDGHGLRAVLFGAVRGGVLKASFVVRNLVSQHRLNEKQSIYGI